MSEETEATTLAFDKAEFTSEPEPAAAPMCASCKRPLGKEYFTVNEAETCEDCHYLLAHQLKEAKGGTAFMRAAGIGALAALGGSIAWYAVAKITGMEIGLLAIAVGYIVGRAVRHGSRGPGGRRYQVLAMLLTYVSITGSYAPAVLKTLDEQQQHSATSAAAAPASTALAGSETPGVTDDAPAKTAPAPAPAVGFAVTFVLVVGISLIAPFLGGASNIIGLVLIAIALYEAWKLNKPVPIVLGGPLRRKKKRKAPAEEAPETAPDPTPGG